MRIANHHQSHSLPNRIYLQIQTTHTALNLTPLGLTATGEIPINFKVFQCFTRPGEGLQWITFLVLIVFGELNTGVYFAMFCGFSP
jgi:hypothetical protein